MTTIVAAKPFAVGARVKYSQEAFECGIEVQSPKAEARRGTVMGYGHHQKALPWNTARPRARSVRVLWDGLKGRHSYHPDFLAVADDKAAR